MNKKLTQFPRNVTGTKYIYLEYHGLCPIVGIGILPPPLSPANVPLPPEPKGGWAHSPAGEGLGSPNSDD
jgi:hypothetical protein